jgi:hypothetical protein
MCDPSGRTTKKQLENRLGSDRLEVKVAPKRFEIPR